MILVHVIPAADTTGHRHEERFPDGTTKEQILAALTQPRQGRDGALPPLQYAYGPLRPKAQAGGPGVAYLDHPGTVVAIGHANERNEFVEDERIQGPPT